MDNSAQNTAKLPQQGRPVVPPLQGSAVQQLVTPQAKSTNPIGQISIGREHAPVQIANDNEEDTTKTQQYNPIQQHITPENIQQSNQESVVIQSSPQEVIQANEVLHPSMPEVVIPQEIEHVVERSTENKFPDTSLLPPEVKPYLQSSQPAEPAVPVPQNDFGIKALPITYDQAKDVEKKTKFNQSTHWLAAKIEYLWRKINPQMYK